MYLIDPYRFGTVASPSAISIVDTSADGNETSGTGSPTSFTASLPATYAANDVVVIHIGISSGTGGNTINTPSGWTSIEQGSAESGRSVALFYKKMTGSEGTTVGFTSTAGSTWHAKAITLRNIAYNDGYYAGLRTNTGGGTSATSEALSDVPSGSLVLHFISATSTGDVSYTPGSGWSEQYDDPMTDVGGRAETNLACTYKADQSGTVNAESGTLSSGSNWWTFSLAFLRMPVAPPSFSVDPSVTSANGFYAIGDTMSGVPGTVNNGYATHAYQWLRDGVDISGETGLSYTLAAADDGKNIQFRHTATNSIGSTIRTTAAILGAYPTYATGNLIPAGDMDSGSDVFIPSGDMDSGGDTLIWVERLT